MICQGGSITAQNTCLARERNDGAVECAYLHYGSLDDAGPILLQHYDTPEQAAALLALGDLSAVGAEPNPPPEPRRHTGDSRPRPASSPP